MKKDFFKAVQVSEKVYWVGAIDWNITDFHGYATSRGTTYNAYLVLDEKITLIDTVKLPFMDEMLARIASVVDPEEISVIVSNHTEMDHSGSLPDVVNMIKPDSVYASKMGLKAIRKHFHSDCSVSAVEDGSSISLGNMELSFYETRMLHWPDSMFTYLSGEGILFSQDAFGMHLASYERFADEIDDSILDSEAAKYFANILMPYAQLILRLISKLNKLDLTINSIFPDHGPVWRNEKDIAKIIERYMVWSEQKPTPKAVVVYDSMWNSTDIMARAIADGIASSGIHVKVMSLQSCHRSDVATEVLESGALMVGSPTLNKNMFPTIADVMIYLKGLDPKNLIGASFGSYGWGGEAVKQLDATLDEMHVERVSDSVRIQYVPDDEALAQCYDLGKIVGERLKEKCEG